MLQNFRVIMKYNPAEAYALAIGHFADRLRGGAPFVQPWPRQERVLSRAERLELQQLLAQRGFYRGTPDGQIRRPDRDALRGFQASIGAPADGFASSGRAGAAEGAVKPVLRAEVTLKNTIWRTRLTAAAEARFMGAKSARLRPDSAIMCDRLTIHCDRAVMPKPKSFLRVFTETGPLVALAVAIALLVGIARPGFRAIFQFRFRRSRRSGQAPQRGGGGWFGGERSSRRSSSSRHRKRRARISPARRRRAKRETVPERNVLVLGDAMADWLAYGLEDAYAEQPDMGVIRKHKTTSGLLKYQPKGEPADWAAAARGILATEKPDAIVVMLGLNDRVALREPAPDKSDKPADKKDDKKDARAKPDAKPADGAADGAPRPAISRSTPNCRRTSADSTPVIAPEKSARSPNGLYEFREERWVELYNKKIEEMIGVLKSKGVPVLWVGLPAIRGQKGTADMLFLDALYREASGQGRHHLCRRLGRLCR